MSAEYQPVLWTADKKTYDRVIAIAVLAYLGVFVGVGFISHSEATIETLLIRALGTCAILLLQVILSIGPLARLNPRFLPLLYNRRHLGVTMFIVALSHGVFSLLWLHGGGIRNPLISVFTSNGSYDSLSQFPFQVLGVAALLILFLMAATSHDFWLVNLTAPTWKALHMMVYVAYGLLIGHVALGPLQDQRSLGLAAILGLGLLWICGLHLLAAFKDPVSSTLLTETPTEDAHMIDACAINDIAINRARIIELSGERVAIFRYVEDDQELVAAVSNVCQHQNGPLGEGKVIDGCITCPWHGYQYRPSDGSSPPPFTEKIPTFRVSLKNDRVLVDPRPLPPGTEIEPARVGGPSA